MNKILVLAALASAAWISPAGQQNQAATISISGAFALYPLTVKWAAEFRKIQFVTADNIERDALADEVRRQTIGIRFVEPSGEQSDVWL